MRQARPARLNDLQARLTRLRETASWLSSHARIGRELRRDLLQAGSPTWKPAEDLAWRTWVARHGDDYAREFVAAIDEILEARAVGIEAGDEPEEAS